MPIETEIIRNGRAYDSGDADVNIDGDMFPGVYLLEYGIDQEHTLNYSLKNNATSWSKGKVNQNGKLGLYMADALALQKKGGGSLIDLKPFWTTSTLTNEDQETITDRVFWKFKNDGRQINGDTGLKMEYEMFVIEVQLNV